MKRLARAVAYLVGLCLFVAIGLELACRWGWLPSEAATLRKRAKAGAKQARVLVLGDSFSVEDPAPKSRTLGNQLRTWFAARNATVVNLARSGFGPADSLDALRYFRTYGPTFHPDLVMFNYYVGNDLTDEKNRMLGGAPRMTWLPGRSGALLEHSYLVRFLRQHAQERALEREAETAEKLRAAAPPAQKAAENPFLVLEMQADPRFLAHNLLLDEPADRAAWEAVQDLLREVKAYADAEGARFLINIIPQTLQVNDSRWKFYSDLGFPMDPRFRTSTVPQDLMKAFCAKESIVCNDLLPAFKAHANVKNIFIENDEHWRTPGHTVAAEAIGAAVEAQHLLR